MGFGHFYIRKVRILNDQKMLDREKNYKFIRLVEFTVFG